MSTPTSERSAALHALWEAGRGAWPALALAADDFSAWLAPRLPPEQDPALLVAADIFLTTACLLKVPGAAEAFLSGPLAAVERHISGILKSEDARAELLQELSVTLLAAGPAGAEPKLGQYSGRGALVVWLRMAATRRALNVGRGKTRLVELDEVVLERVADVDPELSTLRRRHKSEIADIFREATAAVPREDRMLLRLHYVQGSTMAELATLFRTSRSSMHRRIEAIRDELMGRIAALVRRQMRIDASQQGSMLRLFQSDLRDNLRRIMQEDPPEGP